MWGRYREGARGLLGEELAVAERGEGGEEEEEREEGVLMAAGDIVRCRGDIGEM